MIDEPKRPKGHKDGCKCPICKKMEAHIDADKASKLDESYPVPCREVCEVSLKKWCPLKDLAVDECPEGWL